MPDPNNFPDYFRHYAWEGKHALYGYPGDQFPEFKWILSLEGRFAWLRLQHGTRPTASIYLLREMIQWGGSQNGILQKFDDGIGEVNLYQKITEVIANLADPRDAIEAALGVPGMGLTYASKMLRFFDPDTYGALDSRIKKALYERVPNAIPKIHDGNVNSMANGYVEFIAYLGSLKEDLDRRKIIRPECNLPPCRGTAGWRAADIEMALFSWAV
jgi:hypothetical protein